MGCHGLQLWMQRVGWECEVHYNFDSEALMTAYAEGSAHLPTGWKEYTFCHFKEQVNATAGMFVCPDSLHVVRSSPGHTWAASGVVVTLHVCCTAATQTVGPLSPQSGWFKCLDVEPLTHCQGPYTCASALRPSPGRAPSKTNTATMQKFVLPEPLGALAVPQEPQCHEHDSGQLSNELFTEQHLPGAVGASEDL